jgi:hypothetical protein
MFNEGIAVPAEEWREGRRPKDAKTPADKVRDFRTRHNLLGHEMDNLMGFSSDGRATRRWEAEGAPYYVTILMAYADRYGLDVMRELAASRDQG